MTSNIKRVVFLEKMNRTIQKIVTLFEKKGNIPSWRGKNTIRQQGFHVYREMKRYTDNPDYWVAGLLHPMGAMVSDHHLQNIQEMKASRWLTYHGFPDNVYRAILFQQEARLYGSRSMTPEEEDSFRSLPDVDEILLLHDCIKRSEGTSNVCNSWAEPILDLKYVLEN